MPDYLYLLQYAAVLLQIDLTQTHLFACQMNLEYLIHISHETDRNLVVTRLDLTVEPEHTVLIGGRSVQRFLFTIAIHDNVGIIQRLFRSGIINDTCYQVLSLCHAE